jgi:hypothetical protein
MRIKRVALCLLAAATASCATGQQPQHEQRDQEKEHQQVFAGRSAGHVPCRPEEIVVSDFVDDGTNWTWNATCQGKLYVCSEPELSGAGGPACSPK